MPLSRADPRPQLSPSGRRQQQGKGRGEEAEVHHLPLLPPAGPGSSQSVRWRRKKRLRGGPGTRPGLPYPHLPAKGVGQRFLWPLALRESGVPLPSPQLPLGTPSGWGQRSGLQEPSTADLEAQPGTRTERSSGAEWPTVQPLSTACLLSITRPPGLLSTGIWVGPRGWKDAPTRVKGRP